MKKMPHVTQKIGFYGLIGLIALVLLIGVMQERDCQYIDDSSKMTERGM